MAYPGTFFTLIDKSQIPSMPGVNEIDNSPLFMTAFTSDMGPEELTTVKGKEFFELYGNDISFSNHGQPLLQAAAQINAGAKLTCQRVVATDAALANFGISATIGEGGTQKLNDQGQPLYEWPEGVETTEPTHMDGDQTINNDPIMLTCPKVTFEVESIENATNADVLFANFSASVTASKFPLFLITDNGRGVSKKAIRIAPDYSLSKNQTYMTYECDVLYDGEIQKTFYFSLNPNLIIDSASYGFQARAEYSTKQIKVKTCDANIDAYAVALNAALTNGAADMVNQDILFGRTRQNTPLDPSVIWDTTAVDLSTALGVSLTNGSNGAFGTCPVSAANATAYSAALVAAFDGTLTDDVYSVDNNKFIAIFDANYPRAVKDAIEELATFREDFTFFEDFGTDKLTYNSIISYMSESVLKSKFVQPFHNSWAVVDPYSKKNVRVTCTYNLAIAFVQHYINGVNNPFCGIRYSATFPDVIAGTVNFLPAVIPGINQKEEFNDAKINYCSYYNGLLVLETNYTSQSDYTQLSFGNNMMAIQSVMRAIRERCPSTRYALTTQQGLQEYEDDIKENVLANFTSWFDKLNFQYIGDEITLANKRYYASIEVKFVDFIQSEYFNITALPVINA